MSCHNFNVMPKYVEFILVSMAVCFVATRTLAKYGVLGKNITAAPQRQRYN